MCCPHAADVTVEETFRDMTNKIEESKVGQGSKECERVGPAILYRMVRERPSDKGTFEQRC